MDPFSEENLAQHIDRARTLHGDGRETSLEAALIVGWLNRSSAATRLGISKEELARRLGLTIDQYFKRVQAYRALRRFPEAREMLLNGETCITHLTILSSRITDANSRVLLEGIRNKSRREVAKLASRVTSGGELLDVQSNVERTIRFADTEIELLDRAREFLAHSESLPSYKEVIVSALRELLRRRSPHASTHCTDAVVGDGAELRGDSADAYGAETGRTHD